MGTHARHLLVGTALLAGCPGVDLGDTPTDINLCNPAGGFDYFVAEIYPNYVRGDDPANAKSCSQSGGCHQEGGGTALNFKILGARDDTFNYRQAQVFLNCGTREMSTLLTRPLDSIDPHGGGNIYTSADPEHQLFLDWFE